MTTQAQLIRTHLAAGKSITPIQAMGVYGISRLSSCVEDLRNLGLKIDCVMKRDEMGKQYGEYRLRQTLKIGSPVQVKAGHGYGLPQWVRFYRGAKVVARHEDAVLVDFVRGANRAQVWLNEGELVNAS